MIDLLLLGVGYLLCEADEEEAKRKQLEAENEALRSRLKYRVSSIAEEKPKSYTQLCQEDEMRNRPERDPESLINEWCYKNNIK
jgi:hypothetical protein